MKKESLFHIQPLITLDSSHQTHFKIHLHNLNSMHAHMKCICKDNFTSAHVVCYQETWLKPNDQVPEYPHHTYLRQDGCSNNETRRGGLLMYIHDDFRFLQTINKPGISIEHQIAIISPREDMSVRICIVSVYKKPRLPLHQFTYT